MVTEAAGNVCGLTYLADLKDVDVALPGRIMQPASQAAILSSQ